MERENFKLKQNENLQTDFSMEKYLSLPSHLHSALAKFRLSCHSHFLKQDAIEDLHYIQPEKRLCQVCKVIEDETMCYSLILVGTKSIPNFSHHTLDRRFKELMTSHNQ